MTIWEALNQLQNHQMIEGTPKDDYCLQEKYIRKFNDQLEECEYDGYPIGGFDCDLSLLDMYDWKLSKLPEWTQIDFKHAHDWLSDGKEVKCELGEKVYIHSPKSLKDTFLSWDQILQGEWYIKN
ncbi:hypothetical protein [Brevibacillus brevis]|uniref:hypothetical protein n=1 Tax=Brevibacillus brevis TaxID=1393 RepID=UPI0007D8A9A2|nr:hypothetical protein [Brevibacillus brevis]